MPLLMVLQASMSLVAGPSLYSSPKMEAGHFQAALQRIKPSVSPKVSHSQSLALLPWAVSILVRLVAGRLGP